MINFVHKTMYVSNWYFIIIYLHQSFTPKSSPLKIYFSLKTHYAKENNTKACTLANKSHMNEGFAIFFNQIKKNKAFLRLPSKER